MVVELLDAEMPTNICNWSGWTTLMFGVWHNKTDITPVLLKKGADVNQRDDDGGWTVLHCTLYFMIFYPKTRLKPDFGTFGMLCFLVTHFEIHPFDLRETKSDTEYFLETKKCGDRRNAVTNLFHTTDLFLQP